MRGKLHIMAIVLTALLLVNMTGCRRQENSAAQVSTPPREEAGATAEERIIPAETADPEVFLEMLANHPLHRHGELSPDNRYYAYEERSSIILVRLPAAEEYQADRSVVPKVLFIDGMKKDTAFAELEADYDKRLQQPLMNQEELNAARNQLRAVYDWRNFYFQVFSPDGRFLAYLAYDGFGHKRTCSVCVLDLQDNCRQYVLPIEESSEYAAIKWQGDSQTLEIFLPYAVSNGGESLALRRFWHIPSGDCGLAYYQNAETETEQEISLAEAQRIIAEFSLAEEERGRAEEKWDKLTVEQIVAGLSPEELAAEYKRYFTLYDDQKRILQENGYSDEEIAKMDSFDFRQEEQSWPLSETRIAFLQEFYPELRDEDLTQWTLGEYEDYVRERNEAQNAPPAELRQEMRERGLPEELDWNTAKEFHGWENMLAYTNEAIIALYQAGRETEALFRKGEEYRLAVREAYLKLVSGD